MLKEKRKLNGLYKNIGLYLLLFELRPQHDPDICYYLCIRVLGYDW